VAQVFGTHRPLTGVEEAAALAALAEVADGRVDLLAQEAGLAIGFHGQDVDAPMYLQIAQLCIKAGADTLLISRWIEEGRYLEQSGGVDDCGEVEKSLRQLVGGLHGGVVAHAVE
jgi:hypothetical protein